VGVGVGVWVGVGVGVGLGLDVGVAVGVDVGVGVGVGVDVGVGVGVEVGVGVGVAVRVGVGVARFSVEVAIKWFRTLSVICCAPGFTKLGDPGPNQLTLVRPASQLTVPNEKTVEPLDDV
jgi:hypothetical protein